MATIEPTEYTVLHGRPPYTVDDLLEFPEDGIRYELCNGSLLVSPSPMPDHQLAITEALLILQRAAPPDLVTLTAVNLRISAKDFYIPDIVVVPRSSVKRVGLMFAPRDLLLAIEVASPSTWTQDKSLKTEVYAKAGIPAYWRITLGEEPILYVHELNGADYDPPTAYKAGTVAKLRAPFPVSFDPAQLNG